MSTNCPTVNINLPSFWQDPYPVLSQLRANSPICYVPELNATLLCKRDDIVECEQNVDVFSSDQPGGLMNELMGKNMMRKDGDAHVQERRQMQPAVSPKTVKQIWTAHFRQSTQSILDSLSESPSFDLVQDYAMPVSAEALRQVTGLTNVTAGQIDSVSQGMIDGIANYTGDKQVEQRCKESTALIDQNISQMLEAGSTLPPHSILGVLQRSAQPLDCVRANIKLAISGGQNEPRDAIAGTVWALLTHPRQFALIADKSASYSQAFEEYARWISPIGMSPRRIAKSYTYNGISFEPESRVFLMFGSGNRDEAVFQNGDHFDITRNTSKAISFGAGPHFCAGASISRALIGEIALPMLFERFPRLKLNGDVSFGGWAFRGPLSMPVITE